MAKRKQLKPIPTFESEREEQKFWETHDTSDYVDWQAGAVGFFPNLRPTTQTISLRLPSGLLASLRILANKRDVPYQSLLKVYLAERVAREMEGDSSGTPNKRLQPTNRKTVRG
jgi:predicted DNA binding CopG/RHH family protein